MGKLLVLCAAVLACTSIGTFHPTFCIVSMDQSLSICSAKNWLLIRCHCFGENWNFSPQTNWSALHCYKCSFTFFNMPCVTSNVTCKAGEVCANIDGSAVGKSLIKRKDCVDQAKCGTNETETYLKIKYTTTYRCCEGNACNSATTLSSAHLSLSVGLALLGFWFTQRS